jgi:cell division protein FtsB
MSSSDVVEEDPYVTIARLKGIIEQQVRIIEQQRLEIAQLREEIEKLKDNSK